MSDDNIGQSLVLPKVGVYATCTCPKWKIWVLDNVQMYRKDSDKINWTEKKKENRERERKWK